MATPLAPQDLARAGFYAVLARLLLRPTVEVVELVAAQPASDGANDPLAQAWNRVIEQARACGAAAVMRSHDALFVALGTPAINPFASFYLSGSLMDQPLAELRRDLARLGLARADGARELEDHLGALCDAMRALISRGAAQAVQAQFFGLHLQPWARRCLDDIGEAPQAGFYGTLAEFAGLFLAGEAEAFADADPPSPESACGSRTLEMA